MTVRGSSAGSRKIGKTPIRGACQYTGYAAGMGQPQRRGYEDNGCQAERRKRRKETKILSNFITGGTTK